MEIIELKKTGNWKLAKDIYWVTRALTKDKSEVRDHLKHISVKDNTATATDGKRLHHATGIDLPDGFYSVIKRTKTEIILKPADYEINYPDFYFILEIAPESKQIDAEMYDNECFQSYADIIRAMGENCLNYHWVQDVLSNDDPFAAYVKDENNAVIFKTGNKTAAVMPHR